MKREHLVDGWWNQPGEPDGKGWVGTKNAQSHSLWLSAPVQALLPQSTDTDGFVFADRRGRPVGPLDTVMRTVCSNLNIEAKITPHDLRRTFSTAVTRLGYGKDAMNRVTNHKEGGIASVYDRHGYANENKHIMEAVAQHFMSMVEGKEGKVIAFAKSKSLG